MRTYVYVVMDDYDDDVSSRPAMKLASQLWSYSSSTRLLDDEVVVVVVVAHRPSASSLSGEGCWTVYGAMAAAVIVRRRQQQPACSGRWAAGRRRRRRALQRLPATAAAALLAVVLGASPTSAEQLERVLDDVAGSAAIGRLGRAPLADGCARVYVDVGTNVGVQIRKLFEADKYRGAMVLGYFNVLFGNGTSRATDGALCAFGFEPNPLMTPRLRQLEESYAAQGWRVRIFTETAAGASDGVVNISYGESMADSLATMAGAPAGARPALGGAVRLERRSCAPAGPGALAARGGGLPEDTGARRPRPPPPRGADEARRRGRRDRAAARAAPLRRALPRQPHDGRVAWAHVWRARHGAPEAV